MLKDLGQKIKLSRKKKYPDDTVTTFALRVGVSRGTYLKMEKGNLSVSLGAYYSAARILDLSEGFDHLFTLPVSLLDD